MNRSPTNRFVPIGAIAAAVTILSCSNPAQGYSLATSYATSYASNYSGRPLINDLGYWDYGISSTGDWGDWGGWNGWGYGGFGWGFNPVSAGYPLTGPVPISQPYRYFTEPPIAADQLAAEYVLDWGKAGEQQSFARVFTEAGPYGIFKTPLERARER